MSTPHDTVHVLICEDSPTYAVALRALLEHDSDLVVDEIASSGEAALAYLADHEPDLVTMDIELPGIGGLEAVEQIMGTTPRPILVISSHLGLSGRRVAAALAAGALDVISKDDLEVRDADGTTAVALRNRARLLSHVRVIHHPRSRLRPQPPTDSGRLQGAAVVGICSSTGGPQALLALLGHLPATFAIPVLVVQHISPGFTTGLADWLDASVPLPVRVGAGGEPLRPGVAFAPEGSHLRLTGSGRLEEDRTTVAGLHRPSGDVLLASCAASAGSLSVAVVLSGMGSDGAEGARAVHLAGGLVLAQDEASSSIDGMPKVAAERAGARRLAPEEIAAELLRLKPTPFTIVK